MANKHVVCPLCKRKYISIEGVGQHIEDIHADNIPKYMENGAQYYYFLKTGKSEGKCVVCGKPTKWNNVTNKYSRLCGNPKCKEALREIYLKNMIGKYNKPTLTNDPEHQRKMVMGRSISGQYVFKDGTRIPYVGSYEKDFLQFMDVVFNWDPADIMAPSPHTYYYDYKGKRHFYIPDIYIPSLDLNIEIKDGGNNPNKHPKIQDVDKVKERLKDEIMLSMKTSYIKLYNKNYGNFLLFLNKKKENYMYDMPDNPIFLIEDVGRKKVVLEATTRHIERRINMLRTFKTNYPYRYDNTMKFIKKELSNARDAKDFDELADVVNMIEKKIKHDIASDKTDNSYQYEGRKTLDYINSYIKPQIEANRTTIKEASTIKDMIYDKASSADINEISCPKGFYFREKTGAIRWNAIQWIDGKAWRDCVETLVFKDNKVYALESDNGFYIFPGGSKSHDIPDIKQAEREVHEEAKLEIASITGPVAKGSFQYDKLKGDRFGKFKYIGKVYDIYVATYKARFAGNVAKADEFKNMERQGRFMDISTVYDKLKPEYRKAVDVYKGLESR